MKRRDPDLLSSESIGGALVWAVIVAVGLLMAGVFFGIFELVSSNPWPV